MKRVTRISQSAGCYRRANSCGIIIKKDHRAFYSSMLPTIACKIISASTLVSLPSRLTSPMWYPTPSESVRYPDGVLSSRSQQSGTPSEPPYMPIFYFSFYTHILYIMLLISNYFEIFAAMILLLRMQIAQRYISVTHVR